MRNGLILIVAILIGVIFRSWFITFEPLSAGDWPYLFLENVAEFSFLPDSEFLWLAPYHQIPPKIFVQYFGLAWEYVERLFWFWPFIVLSVASSYYLTKSWIGVLIYTANTYILMIVSGGQMGIALSYSIAPLALARFIKLIDYVAFSNKNFQFSIFNFQLALLAGLVLAIETMFDPRISYITLIAIVIYAIFNLKKSILNTLYLILYTFLIPLGVTLLINLYWIIPVLYGNIPSEYRGLQSVEGFVFLSFTDFSHAFSLLHPNWPENIFGKIYFLQPEFILLPIIAYASLLFIKNPKSEIRNPKQNQNSKFQIQNNLTMKQFNNRTIVFFALLGIIGAFLAKGANEPFGQINQFLFEYFPGMSMFRDSTKFYLMIAISYSVLIPFSLEQISKKVSGIRYKVLSIVPVLFLLFWALFINQALLGRLSGTFKPEPVPNEYIEFKNFLLSQNKTLTTLWVPEKQRFGFSSSKYPSVSAKEDFGSAELLLTIINKDPAQILDMEIKYVVVPHDSRKEIFVDDRKYKEEIKENIEEELNKVSWLKRLDQFSQIAVYEVIPEEI